MHPESIRISLLAFDLNSRLLVRSVLSLCCLFTLHVPASTISEPLSDVRSVLDNRCVVCHACYDAPCQLKLSSMEGIKRGITDQLVYDGARLNPIEPTRLFFDAKNTRQWREKDFHPVLNETNQSSGNLKNSLLYQVLEQKRKAPLPSVAVLDDNFDFSLNRENSCPKVSDYKDYAKNNPLAGMPYGFPGLSDAERELIRSWLENGAEDEPLEPLSGNISDQLVAWESLLNQKGNKAQLASRYLYEHLFLAHLFFSNEPDVFFSLVRSRTPTGKPIDIIPTRRPYDSPGTEVFYYRLWRQQGSIVSKTHMPYMLNKAKLKRTKQLFFDTDYQVEQLPVYSTEVASNPFRTFKAIPLRSRYQFMLDEARFTIQGFIKGPVCRGQTALNVIDDHFWVFFCRP